MMVKQGTLLSELQSIVGEKHASEPRDDYECAVDGLSPQAVVEPGTYEEVAEILRFANSERLAVIPRGSSFCIDFGNIPRRYDISLKLARLDKIIEHEPADLTVTCQAGISVAVLNGHLAANGQMVPFGGASEDPRTVGGLLAANESNLHAAYGRPRDFTLGLRFVTGDGLMAKTGGRVVKNVAGYDFGKVLVGSFGTLAIIVESTFKIAPLPQATQTLGLEFRTAEGLTLFSSEVRRRCLPVLTMDATRLMRPKGKRYGPVSGYLSRIAVGGSKGGTERAVGELQALTATHHATPSTSEIQSDIDESPPSWATASFPLVCQATVPPSHLPDIVHAFEDEAPGPFLNVDLMSGQVAGTWLGATNQPDLIERLRAAATRLGGHLVVRDCSPELKREIDVFGPPPPSFALMRAIKQQFDPNNVLSPGRFVGKL